MHICKILSIFITLSGAQQHAIGAAVGLVFGISAEKWIQRKAAHKDAVIYQYIVSHPEDFAPIG